MAGPPLRELQALFWRTLNGASEPALEAAVVSTPGLAAAERLDIYGRMYFWRLHDALAEDFEKTAAALGSERFADVVRGYLAEHPSGHPSVRHLGRDFAGFLAARPPDGAPAWLADLGRLEWIRVEVFDAADAIGLRDKAVLLLLARLGGRRGRLASPPPAADPCPRGGRECLAPARDLEGRR